MKQKELDQLYNADKIELVKVKRHEGFTLEQTQYIVNELIKAFNDNSDDEEIVIKVNRFTLTVGNTKRMILNTLNRFNAVVKVEKCKKQSIWYITKQY